jgi:hypothetical protein
MTDNAEFGFRVDLPAGGTMYLLTEEEVELFEGQSKRYQEDYALEKLNDLMLMGAILTQQIMMFRAQQQLSGLEPEFDSGGKPTGRYIKSEKRKASETRAIQETISACAKEVRDLEKALGIDKKTREAGGQHTVAAYLTMAKRAAHQYGVHISERTLAYEDVMMRARMKIRVLRNGDDEDMAYEDVSEAKIINWLEAELRKLEDKDKEWAKTKGKVFLGKM